MRKIALYDQSNDLTYGPRPPFRPGQNHTEENMSLAVAEVPQG